MKNIYCEFVNKAAGIVLCTMLVINFLMLAFRKIDNESFWFVILYAGIAGILILWLPKKTGVWDIAEKKSKKNKN